MTAWRPFFVEITTKTLKGTEAPYTYNPKDKLVKLCGPLSTIPQRMKFFGSFFQERTASLC